MRRAVQVRRRRLAHRSGSPASKRARVPFHPDILPLPRTFFSSDRSSPNLVTKFGLCGHNLDRPRQTPIAPAMENTRVGREQTGEPPAWGAHGQSRWPSWGSRMLSLLAVSAGRERWRGMLDCSSTLELNYLSPRRESRVPSQAGLIRSGSPSPPASDAFARDFRRTEPPCPM
jgi:hypothetical protein